MNDEVTNFYEGDGVSYTGVSMPPAQGQLMSFASEESAWVLWKTGARSGQIDLLDLHDLERTDQLPSYLAVKHAMAIQGEAGVISHLAAERQLGGWQGIAAEVLQFTASRIRSDSSMDDVYGQLDPAEAERVIARASLTLLRDAFGEST